MTDEPTRGTRRNRGGQTQLKDQTPASPSPSSKETKIEGRDGIDSERQLKAIRFSELGVPKRREYLVENFVARGYPATFYGDGGTAKSYLALSLSIAIARGADTWLDLKIKQAPVLYLDFELDEEEQRRRSYHLSIGESLKQPPDDLLYMSALGHSSREAFDIALKECQLHHIGLLVIDSVGMALEGDSESAKDVIKFYDTVRKFQAMGVTPLIIDHQSKPQPGQRSKDKREFGSTYKGLLSRSTTNVQTLDRAEGTLKVALTPKKRNFGGFVDSMGARLTFSEDSVTVERAEVTASDLDETSKPNAAKTVRRALSSGPAFVEDLKEKTGLAKGTIQNAITDLKKRGEVELTDATRGQAQQVRLVSTPPYSIGDEDGDTN